MHNKELFNGFFRRRDNKGYLFLVPYFLVFLLFQLYPIISTFLLSLQNSFPAVGESAVGFSNYQRLFTTRVFYQSVMNTWYIWLCNFIPQIVFALYLAVALSDTRLGGREVLRTVYFLPNLVTASSIGVLFAVLLDWNHGALNHFLIQTGLIRNPIYWLGRPLLAQGTVSFIQWWQWFGYTMIIMMAGLSAISTEMYEAAYIDGAKRSQVFFRITLPLLKPTMLYVLVTSLIGGMQIFDIPRVLTNGRGAPDNALTTMVLYLYNQAFRNYNTGYAASVAYALFIIILIFSALFFKVLNPKEKPVKKRRAL